MGEMRSTEIDENNRAIDIQNKGEGRKEQNCFVYYL